MMGNWAYLVRSREKKFAYHSICYLLYAVETNMFLIGIETGLVDEIRGRNEDTASLFDLTVSFPFRTEIMLIYSKITSNLQYLKST
jgi:hypothetical protein